MLRQSLRVVCDLLVSMPGCLWRHHPRTTARGTGPAERKPRPASCRSADSHGDQCHRGIHSDNETCADNQCGK
jgi:hypothetical protein